MLWVSARGLVRTTSCRQAVRAMETAAEAVGGPGAIMGGLGAIDVAEEAAVPDRPEYPWKRAKKVAAMLSFSGKNYYGMQRNPGPEINTIERELLAALAAAGAGTGRRRARRGGSPRSPPPR